MAKFLNLLLKLFLNIASNLTSQDNLKKNNNPTQMCYKKPIKISTIKKIAIKIERIPSSRFSFNFLKSTQFLTQCLVYHKRKSITSCHFPTKHHNMQLFNTPSSNHKTSCLIVEFYLTLSAARMERNFFFAASSYQ